MGNRPRDTERAISPRELQRRIDARFERLLARKYPGLRFRITHHDSTRDHADEDHEDAAGRSPNVG